MPAAATQRLRSKFATSLVALTFLASFEGRADTSPVESLYELARLNPSDLLAAKKSDSKKKKKKKKSEEDDFGPADIAGIADNDSGVGIHREQEGVDTPYVAELAGATSLSLLSTEIKDGKSSSTTLVDIDGHMIFLLGSFGLGPDLGIKYSTKTEDVVDEATKESESVETKTTRLRAGLLGKYYFSNIDRSLNVFFVHGGVSYQMLETKAGKADALKGTGSIVRLGGGVDMFLDSNIAASPQIEYVVDSQTNAAGGDAKDVSSTTSGIRLLLELATFL